MPNLVSASLKSSLEQARDNVFDSFSRPLVAWKTPAKTILSTDTNFYYSYEGPDYQNDTDLVEYTPVSGTFQACILYDKALERIFANPQGSRDENFRIVMDEGLCRVKLKKDDYDTFIKDSIDIQFDGYQFKIDRTERPHGLFNPKYYTLYLKFQN